MLLIIDFSNLLVRHAMVADRTGGDGALSTLKKVESLMTRYNPDYLLIAKDDKRDNLHRRTASAAYKAHRENLKGPDISEQFRRAYQAIELFGWPVIGVEGYEADDVIASAVAQFETEKIIVSSDKDMLALSDRAKIQMSVKGEVIDCGADECRQILGVAPNLVRDYKAIVGDSSDGYAGIPGVGPKGAIQLLEQFGGLLNIYADKSQFETLSPGLRKKLIEGEEDALMSYQLANMHEDLEIGSLDELTCPERRDDEKLRQWLTENNLSGMRSSLSDIFTDL